jgi:hypothetical protein
MDKKFLRAYLCITIILIIGAFVFGTEFKLCLIISPTQYIALAQKNGRVVDL